MSSLALITGAGSGIGRALSENLAARGIHVIAIARRSGPLQTLADAHAGRIEPVSLDVAHPEAPQQLLAALGGRKLDHLVHNAGTLEPAGPLAETDRAAFERLWQTNLAAPLFITQALLPHFHAGARVLHVSSGAAHRPMSGWGPYCISKSALHMLYRCWQDELAARGILVGSARPGVVDTPMQQAIRNLSSEAFPAVEHFRRLKSDGELTPPATVARFLAWLLTEADPDIFTSAENDIRDEALVSQWYGP